jgi:LysM repeat protein
LASTLIKRVVGALAALALTLGVAAATTTPAASAANVWDRVAECESGGNWKINTGNGYYGGLQFSPSTWRGYGGGKYASTANLATKSEQIAIARRVLSGQGPGAWPVCSRKAGLTKANGKAAPASNSGSVRVGSKSSSSKSSNFKASSEKKSSVDKKLTGVKGIKVRVKRGDTLAKIANRYDVRGGWRSLYQLNKKTLRSPHIIEVGQVLLIKT